MPLIISSDDIHFLPTKLSALEEGFKLRIGLSSTDAILKDYINAKAINLNVLGFCLTIQVKKDSTDNFLTLLTYHLNQLCNTKNDIDVIAVDAEDFFSCQIPLQHAKEFNKLIESVKRYCDFNEEFINNPSNNENEFFSIQPNPEKLNYNCVFHKEDIILEKLIQEKFGVNTKTNLEVGLEDLEYLTSDFFNNSYISLMLEESDREEYEQGLQKIPEYFKSLDCYKKILNFLNHTTSTQRSNVIAYILGLIENKQPVELDTSTLNLDLADLLNNELPFEIAAMHLINAANSLGNEIKNAEARSQFKNKAINYCNELIADTREIGKLKQVPYSALTEILIDSRQHVEGKLSKDLYTKNTKTILAKHLTSPIAGKILGLITLIAAATATVVTTLVAGTQLALDVSKVGQHYYSKFRAQTLWGVTKKFAANAPAKDKFKIKAA